MQEQLNLECQWEIAILDNTHPSLQQKVTQQKSCFSTRIFRNCWFSTTWNPVFYRLICISSRPGILSCEGNTITTKVVSQLNCLENRKNLPCKWKTCSCFIQYGLKAHTRKKFCHCFLRDVERWTRSQTRFRFYHCLHTLPQDIHRPDWLELCWCYEGSLASLFRLTSKPKSA